MLDIKNVYNNFQSRKIFHCPPMERNLPDGCSAYFKDIVDLFDHEASMSLKKAHRLSPATLHPKSIEKTSVKLATSVFCESTRDALRYYAVNEGKNWAGTADFITLILKVWNVLNVKNRTKGQHKRDYTMEPVQSSQDWKLNFLMEFADFVQSWESSKRPGLTRETFLALWQTCHALRECAIYLLDRVGFKYVLLGHLQSDAIECRFGWLRQLSGANYYISMKQVLDSSRKIRAISLVKFSRFTLADIDEAIVQSEESSSPSHDDSSAEYIVAALTYQQRPTMSELEITYYVAGAMARSAFRTTRCEDCKEILIDSNPQSLEPLTLEETVIGRAATFLDAINRGGLTRPSEFAFILAMNCSAVYDEIKSTKTLRDKLLGATNHRSLFVKIMDRATCDNQLLAPEFYCMKGHNAKQLFIHGYFNCLAKNMVKDLTIAANPQGEPNAKKRKITKLSSKLE